MTLNGEIYEDFVYIKDVVTQMLREGENVDDIKNTIAQESAERVPVMRYNLVQAACDNTVLMVSEVQDHHVGKTICDVIATTYEDVLRDACMEWLEDELDNWSECDKCGNAALTDDLYEVDQEDWCEICTSRAHLAHEGKIEPWQI